MPNVGPVELAIVLVVVLVIFGPRKLPELGKSLGHGMREFKDSLTGKGEAPTKTPQLEAGESGAAAPRNAPPEREPERSASGA